MGHLINDAVKFIKGTSKRILPNTYLSLDTLGLVLNDINMSIINSTITKNNGMMTVGLINTAYLNILNSIFWNNNNEYEFSIMPNNSQLNVNAFYSLFDYDLPGISSISEVGVWWNGY